MPHEQYGFDVPFGETSDGDVIAHLSQPARLRMALIESGPTFIKLGQLLSTRPDLVPEEFIEEFRLFYDTEEQKEVILAKLRAAFEDDELSIRIGYQILTTFLKPNVIYDDAETRHRVAEARKTVARAKGTVLEKERIAISMTEKGDPYENAIAERVNGILKMELLLDGTFNTFNDANEAVAWAVGKYNHIRPHSSCDSLTPELAHEQEGILKKHWKNYPYKPKPTAAPMTPMKGISSTLREIVSPRLNKV